MINLGSIRTLEGTLYSFSSNMILKLLNKTFPSSLESIPMVFKEESCSCVCFTFPKPKIEMSWGKLF
ncbi:MAG TPA: hypothetical protein DCL80_03180, partial [Balneola sp.]|nr:hypothetical protein [Balneola sp.]